MASETKVRPSVTSKDCLIIAGALEHKIMAALESGQVSNPIVLRMAALKEYFLSFQSEENRIEALVQARLAAIANGAAESPVVITTQVEPSNLSAQLDSMVDAAISPIDRDDLTDDQKFDLLSLRTEQQRSDKENQWFLNVGTFIKMKRAGIKSTNVNVSDL